MYMKRIEISKEPKTRTTGLVRDIEPNYGYTEIIPTSDWRKPSIEDIMTILIDMQEEMAEPHPSTGMQAGKGLTY